MNVSSNPRYYAGDDFMPTVTLTHREAYAIGMAVLIATVLLCLATAYIATGMTAETLGRAYAEKPCKVTLAPHPPPLLSCNKAGFQEWLITCGSRKRAI